MAGGDQSFCQRPPNILSARPRKTCSDRRVAAVVVALAHFRHRIAAIALVFDVGRNRVLLVLQQLQHFPMGVGPSPNGMFLPWFFLRSLMCGVTMRAWCRRSRNRLGFQRLGKLEGARDFFVREVVTDCRHTRRVRRQPGSNLRRIRRMSRPSGPRANSGSTCPIDSSHSLRTTSIRST